MTMSKASDGAGRGDEFAVVYGTIKRVTQFTDSNCGSDTGKAASITLVLSPSETSLPETCVSYKVLDPPEHPHHHLQMDPTPWRAIGLSARGRLYLGERLLATGVSSYSVNVNMDTLLCVTGGSRPQLKFLCLLRLLLEDARRPPDGAQSAWEWEECRPVDRGSRLVVSVPGEARVVLQMPRGNLEAIEPRPLALRKAVTLLSQNRVLDCLLFLRRQRIDLNLVVDYSPEHFLKALPALVQDVLLSQQPQAVEVLCLLISSLSPGDVTATKYTSLHTSKQPNNSHVWESGSKVNDVCRAFQNELWRFTRAATDENSSEKIMTPLLSAYASHRPPMLVEALQAIRVLTDPLKASTALPNGPSDYSLPGTTPSTSSALGHMQHIKAQQALKYLVFLVDQSQLFDAALGVCDFDLARVIGKLGQMDPREYTVLITRFESIPSTVTSADLGRAMTRFEVYLHLKRWHECVTAGLEALAVQTTVTEDDVQQDQLYPKLVMVIKDNGLYEFAAPLLLEGVDRERQRRRHAQLAKMQRFFSDVLGHYGETCSKGGRHAEAIYGFLCASPVRAKEAISSALRLANWSLALAISGVHYQHASGKNEGSDEPVALSMKDVAQEIVETYRAMLEQGQGNLDDSAAVDDDDVGVGGARSDGSVIRGVAEDQAVDAARLCIDFLGDVEAAVNVLVLSQHWLEAILTSCRHNRRDLLVEVSGQLVYVDPR